MTTEPSMPSNQFSRFMVPATAGGRWCVASFGVGVVGFVAMVVSVGSGQEGGEAFSDNWWISGPALLAVLGAVGALATGLFAIVRQRERAAPVVLATVVGALVSLFMLGEVSTPH
jgi:hypothetical protein